MSEMWRCRVALDAGRPLVWDSSPFFLRIAPGLGLQSY